MSNALTDQFISDSYVGQLHLGLSSLPQGGRQVYDGLGNPTSLYLAPSGQGASITGSLTAGKMVFPSLTAITTLIDFLYPVGSVFISLENTNPGIRFSGTLWEQTSQGKFIVGVGTGIDSNNNSATFGAGDNESGDYSTFLTEAQIPEHYHFVASADVSFENDQRPTANDYVAVAKNPAGVGTLEYGLAGINTVATIGKTSGVVRSTAVSGTNLTSPSYGLYIWKRIG